MRIATLVVRTLMGLLFIFESVTYFLDLITPPPVEGPLKVFNEGLEVSVYLIPLAKAIELLCGLAFVSGRFVTLASVLIAPIIVNIVLVHAFLAPEGLPAALFLVIANTMVAWSLRERYRALFTM